MSKLQCGAILILTQRYFCKLRLKMELTRYIEYIIFALSSLTLAECWYVSHNVERGLCLKIISVCKRGLTGHTTPTVRGICKFAVFFSVS